MLQKSLTTEDTENTVEYGASSMQSVAMVSDSALRLSLLYG